VRARRVGGRCAVGNALCGVPGLGRARLTPSRGFRVQENQRAAVGHVYPTTAIDYVGPSSASAADSHPSGQSPDLVKLNLVFEGAGAVPLKEIEILATPLEPW